jgi:hypothetical protein
MKRVAGMMLVMASALCVTVTATEAPAATSLNVFERASAPRTEVRAYAFDLVPGQDGFAWATAVNLRSGTVEFKLTDPRGEVVTRFSGRQLFTGPAARSGDKAPAGTYRLDVIATDAVGRWQAQFAPLPARSRTRLQTVGAGGMILVALAAVAWWSRIVRRRGADAAGGTWRWFWVGAGLWVAGVAIKVVIALLANQPVLEFLDVMLPYPAFVLAGGVYVGVISAICEITLIAIMARYWRRLSADAERAVAIGVGAGAFEAALLGMAAAAAATLALTNVGEAATSARAGFALMTAATPLAWLVAPVERALTIPCHVASRAMTLLGAAQRRRTPIVAGFALFAAIDSVAGAAHVSGRLGMCSLWWMELAVLPVALISLALIRHCLRAWPPPPPRQSPPPCGPASGDVTGEVPLPDRSTAATPPARITAAACASTTHPSPCASQDR